MNTPFQARPLAALLAALLLPGMSWAATSANYNLQATDPNNGAGVVSSASYRLSSSVGDSVLSTPLASGSFALRSGFIAQVDRPIAVLSAGSLNFPSQGVGSTSAPLTLTVLNAGVAPLSISGISAALGDFAAAPSASCFSGALATNASCSISVTFTPTAAAARNAFLTITANAALPLVALSGTGVLNSQVIFFGSYPSLVVGSSGTLTATASSGLTPVQLSSSTPGICSVSGNTVTGLGAGTCSILGIQVGNGVWATGVGTANFSVGAATGGTGDVPLPAWALGALGAGLMASLRRRSGKTGR